MYRDSVEEIDAICVIRLMESAFSTGAFGNFEVDRKVLMDAESYSELQSIFQNRMKDF